MGRLRLDRIAGLVVGEPVTAVDKVGEEVYYGTAGGEIGCLGEIGKEAYDILRRMEEECSSQESSGRRFSYSGWRGHAGGTERLIDGCLVMPRLCERGRNVREDYALAKLGKILPLLVI
jgi:hypothetical protein